MDLSKIDISTAISQRRQRALACTRMHELLALAIEDFEAVLKDPCYGVNMACWYVPPGDIFSSATTVNTSDKCYVCLAGAVLAQSYGFEPQYTKGGIRIEDVPRDFMQQCFALNQLRVGDVYTAYKQFYGMAPFGSDVLRWQYPVRSYNVRDQEGFVSDLKGLVGWLKERNL